MYPAEKTSILVVDDMPDKLLTIRVVLEELEQEIVCVSSGREALRALLEREFAVVLLDVSMPEMDGFETASLIRKRKRSEHTPIIFLTAYDDEKRRWQSYSLGAVDFIPTPVIPEMLRAKVAVFVELFQKTEQVKRQAQHEVALAREQAARAAAEEANRRSTFLAEASSQLGGSLDFDATIAALLKIPVPFLCDATMLLFSGWRGEGRFLEYRSRDERLSQSATETSCQLTQKPLESLSPELVAALEDTFSIHDRARVFAGPVLRSSDASSAAPRQITLAPLVARGRTLGVLGLIRNEVGCEPDEANLILAQELASRGGIAIDNARLHGEIQEGNQRKDEFLAMLGHELRNPLGAISNAISLLSLTVPQVDAGGQQVLEIQSILQRQVRQMNRLIDDLLDVSRITRGKIHLRKEAVELTAILERAVATCEPAIRAREHELYVQHSDQPLKIFADAARIEQVVTNLLTNATKYSEPGGKIWLSTERSGDRVEVHVRDTGLGISEELLQNIFDLFVQGERSIDRSQGGLGIGLTLVRSLVEMHGGEVRATSDGPQLGSTFSVSLPAFANQAERGAEANLSTIYSEGNGESPSTAVRRMLVVEDNLDVASTFKQLLSAAGHEVHLAHDGALGVEAAEKLKPDVIFIDIGLPAMDGFAVARHLRATGQFSSTVLVAMTGYGQPDDRRKTREAGFDYHLTKPVPMEELAQLLNSLAMPAHSTIEQEAHD